LALGRPHASIAGDIDRDGDDDKAAGAMEQGAKAMHVVKPGVNGGMRNDDD